jgi:anti-sigma B factor antagonist
MVPAALVSQTPRMVEALLTFRGRSSAGVHLVPAEGDSPGVARLIGELDLGSVEPVENVLMSVADQPRDLVLDLSGLAFCDCTGLSMIIRLSRRCAANGRRLRLAAPQEIVRMVLVVTRLVDAVPVHATVAGAVRGDEAERIRSCGDP